MAVLRKFLPSKPELLSVGLWLLQLIGLWGDRRNVYRYRLAILCMLCVLIGPKAVLGSGKDGLDSIARNVAEMIFLIEVCISIGIFASRRASFERVVDVLKEILRRPWPMALQDDIDGFHRKMDLFARIYAVYIGFMLLLYVGVPVISTTLKMILVDEEERSDFMLIIELQFYWLDIRRNIIHYVIYMILCTAAVSCSAYQSLLKGSVILVVIQYGTKLFEMVSKRISMMATMENVEDRRSELREIVELHSLALKYVEHLEATVSFMLINQILNCILIWCLMMFYVSINFGPNAANVILLFVVLMGEMVVYCVNGTMLREKALGVAQAMYDYPWYNESAQMQKDMKIIIQRAQVPTGITAAKFYYVNIERLGLVIQASYSYYLILKKRF